MAISDIRVVREPMGFPNKSIVVIRGGGDIATGVVQKFRRSGLKVLILETAKPTAIRRTVSLCEAVYDEHATVEDISCERIATLADMDGCHARGMVPLIVDPDGECIRRLKPAAVIDAIIAKKNTGTKKDMATVTIGLGPGFNAGEDVHAVIETNRGHDLGRLILQGRALADTGVPGEIGGKSGERVVHAPAAGEVRNRRNIGEIVEKGETICEIAGKTVTSPFRGVLRGLIREGLPVPVGMKIADVDPRLDVDCRTISDKARCIGGAALEAFLFLSKKQKQGERL